MGEIINKKMFFVYDYDKKGIVIYNKKFRKLFNEDPTN